VCQHISQAFSHADGTIGASVYILCIDKLLNKFKRRFKHFEHMKFTVSFITDLFQERD
jgi:hypothetical protein